MTVNKTQRYPQRVRMIGTDSPGLKPHRCILIYLVNFIRVSIGKFTPESKSGGCQTLSLEHFSVEVKIQNGRHSVLFNLEMTLNIISVANFASSF